MSDRRKVIKSIVIFGFMFLILNTATVSAIAPPPPPPGGGSETYDLFGSVKKYGTLEPLSGARVKLYAEGIYVGSVYTSSTGAFSKTVTRPNPCDFFKAVVSKTGYQTKTSYAGPDWRNDCDFGVITLISATPPKQYPSIGEPTYIRDSAYEATFTVNVDWNYDPYVYRNVNVLVGQDQDSLTSHIMDRVGDLYQATVILDSIESYVYKIQATESWYSGEPPTQDYATSYSGYYDVDPSSDPIVYSIHGYLRSGFNGHPISGASVTLFRSLIVPISTTTTNQEGYYSYTYTTYDPMEVCMMVSSAVGFDDGQEMITVSGTDVDMGMLTLDSSIDCTKYAVLVGISNYKIVGDLSYCDEDITAWYNYLTSVAGFLPSNIWVYGDRHDDNYPAYHGLATESNVRAALQNLSTLATQNDMICFITSGHGAGDGEGSSYLRMWDSEAGEGGYDGNLYDTELDDYVGAWNAGKIFIFVDHCYSGGLIPEIEALDNYDCIYMTTTCSDSGEGHELVGISAWTYYFLDYGLIQHFENNPSTTMQECFDYAFQYYPYYGTDDSQESDGLDGFGFTL